MYYTRRGPNDHESIVQATISIRTGKLTSPLRTISRGMVTDDAEGPHLYKVDGWYYLIEAEGGARFLHMETVGRSKVLGGRSHQTLQTLSCRSILRGIIR